MSLSQIELTCLAVCNGKGFTVGKRYPAAYLGSSTYSITDNNRKILFVNLCDNGSGNAYDGALMVAMFKHLVTLKNESL